jgi:hypothetical protein
LREADTPTTSTAEKENKGLVSGDGLDWPLNDLHIQQCAGGYDWYIIPRSHITVTQRLKWRPRFGLLFSFDLYWQSFLGIYNSASPGL